MLLQFSHEVHSHPFDQKLWGRRVLQEAAAYRNAISFVYSHQLRIVPTPHPPKTLSETFAAVFKFPHRIKVRSDNLRLRPKTTRKAPS